MAEAVAKWRSTVVEYTTASEMGHNEQIDEDELNRLLNAAYEASTAVAAVPCRSPEDLLLKVYMLALVECGLVGPGRSEERRVGKGCGSTCRSRWSPVM